MSPCLRVLTAVALLTGAAALPAEAAKPRPKPPKPACNLVTDGASDAGMFANAGGATTYDTNLDIVGADVASNGKNLSVIFRIKDLNEQDNLAPGGRTWSWTFTNGNNSVGLSAYVGPGGPRYSAGAGRIDYVANTIQIDVALKDIAYAKIAKGSVLKTFYLTSNAGLALPPPSNNPMIAPPGAADEARSGSSYVVGYPSCVKVPA